MQTAIVEVTNGPLNWGKFLIGRMDDAEWIRTSVVAGGIGRPLLSLIGFDPATPLYLVFDLQTREGAMFKLGGYAKADLDKHKVWVCPMFEPFLDWLYTEATRIQQAGGDVLRELPTHVDLPDAPFAMAGYRRDGSNQLTCEHVWAPDIPHCLKCRMEAR